MMIKRLFPITSFLLLVLLNNCAKEEPGPITDIGVYFNEVKSTGGDWLEIYNSTTTTVNLTGFKVYDDPTDKYTIATGSITAKGFFVLNCDGTGIGGNASFKLSGLGETIYLEDNKGNLIDKITFPALTSGTTYARFPDGGDWANTGLATKGSSNGGEHAPSINLVERSPIVPGLNDAVIVSAIVEDISGISSVKVFYRKDANAFVSITMALSAGKYSGTIPAANATGTIEYYVEAANTAGATTVDPDNAPSKVHSYLLNDDDISVQQTSLKINEFLASNTTCCPDNSSGTAEYDDWIEIYNGSGNGIDLNGYYLSDDPTNPYKFKIEGSTVIAANGFLLIYADEQGSQGKFHANFQLDQAGEQVGLYYIDGREIDKYIFSTQTSNLSWGRTTDGASTWKSWNTPTPGATNQ